MKKRSIIITLLFSLFFLIGCDTFIVSPLIPLITSNFKIRIGSGGYMVTAYSVFYVIFSPLLGPLSDKYGRKKMLIIGTLIFSLSSFATAAAPNYFLIIVVRSLTGIGAACAAPNVWSFIGDHFDYNERGKVTFIVASALSIGMVLGVPIGSFLTQTFDWQAIFYVLGIASLIVSLLINIYFPAENITYTINSSYIIQFKKVFNSESVGFSFLVTLFIAFANFGLYTFLGFWLNKQFNLNVSCTGLFLVLAGLGNLAGMQIGCNFSDRFSKKRIVIISTIILAITLILLPIFRNNIYATAIDIFLWLGAGGASFSVMQVLITQLSSEARGTVMGINNSFFWLGTASGSAITGLIINNFTFSASAVVCSLSAFLAAVCMAIFIHERKENSSNASSL